MQLYNTLTHKIEELQPQDGKTIRMYTCGPTVYNYVHIGNLRSFISADLLYRALNFDGFTVNYVMNITDVDDKTIKGAVEKYGKDATVEDLHNYTTKYLNAFLADLASVNIDTSNIKFIRVSEVIPQIQEFILELISKGFAYHADDGVYFNIEEYQKQFHDYGALVGEKFLTGKKIGARVAVDEYDKENLSDFALWKAHTEADGNIFWEHEVLGKGRPGWHIECSVINKVAFNDKPSDQPIDIHTGGVDLIFPHHTNEIAQSQPLGPFVKHWMHPEHLMVQDDKMAKSKQNFFTVRDIEDKGFTGTDLRYLYLQSHYKTQANFTWESLGAAQSAVKKLKVNTLPITKEDTSEETNFSQAINDDLNIPKALACAWNDKQNLSVYDKVFGLGLSETEIQEIPREVKALLEERQVARDNKDFTKSDELRDEIAKLGYEVKDTNNGQQTNKK